MSVSVQTSAQVSGHNKNNNGEKVRRKRWTTKVRTGCVTCKNRHVKCDEAKPHCLRCIKAGKQCEGYHAPRLRVFQLPYNASIYSQHHCSWDAGNQPNVSLLSSHLPIWRNYGTIEEIRALQCFQWAVTLLMDPEGTNFYVKTTIVPQLAWEHDVIKHAVTAMGLQVEAKLTTVGFAKSSKRGLQYYVKAMEELSHGKPRTDVVLLASNLMYSYEIYCERMQSAAIHLLSGFSILKEWKKKSRGDFASKLDSNCNTMIEEYVEPMYMSMAGFAQQELGSYLSLPPCFLSSSAHSSCSKSKSSTQGSSRQTSGPSSPESINGSPNSSTSLSQYDQDSMLLPGFLDDITLTNDLNLLSAPSRKKKVALYSPEAPAQLRNDFESGILGVFLSIFGPCASSP